MRIITLTGEFTLPADFEAQLSRYNVLLSDAGEQTAPITLPADPEGNNLRLVGWSNRTDTYYKPLTDLDVLVVDGLMHRKANLGIHTADDEDGISCTLYFGTADFYSRAGETKLNSLPWTSFTLVQHGGSTLAQKLAYVIAAMKNEYSIPTVNSPFIVTPLATTHEYEYELTMLRYNDVPLVVREKRTFVLNDFDMQPGISFTPTFRNGTINKFMGEAVQHIYQNDALVDLPVGYGMSPFLKTRYVLEFLFSHFGFTLDTTALEAVVPEYHEKSFVTNNVADAICDGIINYNQLVPDVTIKEFIQYVETKFGGKIVTNETTKKATFLLLEDQLYYANADMDLTPYLASKIKMGSAEFKPVKIVDTGATSTDTEITDTEAETIEVETIKQTQLLYTFRPLDENVFFLHSFWLPTIEEIVHLKTVLQIENATVKETSAASSKINIIQRVTDWKTKQLFYIIEGYTAVVNIEYRTCTSLFGEREITPLAVTNTFYNRYKAFRQFSNVPLTATIHIPDKTLSNLNIYVPKKLQGQYVMIEKLEHSTKPGSVQNFSFRTLRPFADR